MLDFDNIQAGAPLNGIEPNLVVIVVAVTRISADTIKIVYERPDGTNANRLLTRDQAANIEVATVGRPWSFEGDGAAFQLAIEATVNVVVEVSADFPNGPSANLKRAVTENVANLKTLRFKSTGWE